MAMSMVCCGASWVAGTVGLSPGGVVATEDGICVCDVSDGGVPNTGKITSGEVTSGVLW